MNFKNLPNILKDNREIALVTIVIAVILMMIVPLSTVLMDAIIGFNIGISVLVLMVVIYMRSTLSLTAFPSVLLVLALIRIGITVSTSRLILLDGDAGHIVTTFGEFVVGGNLVVGIIIFVIITIINFIVITKGSERVAEVAARFSLDAMPGKQMSIDSDLRAGNITMEQAQAKRRDLGLESKLFGAMDGAMKFVKGDAIASIIDILINLVGGLIIGMMSRGMSFSDAISTYSILTVGDGLVQQIPALIISLTAGMMITRVGDDEDQQNMGKNILSQVFRDYRAIFAACGLLSILAFIPGMPSYIFITLVAVFAFIAYKLKQGSKKSQGGNESTDAVIDEEDQADKVQEYTTGSMPLVPIMLCVASEYHNSKNAKQLKSIITEVGQQILADLGVAIPQIIIRYSEKVALDSYQLQMFELPVVSGNFYWKKILLLDDNKQSRSVLTMDDSEENTMDFGVKDLGIWINVSNMELCQEYKFRFLNFEEFLILYFKEQIKKFISDFLGIQEVKEMLDRMSEYQELIKELLRMLPLNKITEVFQRLVAEGISIRNFKVILDSMLEWAQRDKEVIIITEHVRRALGRFIAFKFSQGSALFSCIVISHDLEDMVRDSIRYSDNGSYLSLDPRAREQIIIQVKSIIDQSESVSNIIILTHMDIRRYVRSIVEREYAWLPVLSYQELEGHAQFNSIGVVELD
ncbi:MAG: type III secretion system export apparatus subunit SctV [Neisseriaceae bacterium]